MKSNKFSGKRLLVLGSNVGATDIVEYARSHGAITMVADYLPPEKSAAKQVADEHFLISTLEPFNIKACRIERTTYPHLHQQSLWVNRASAPQV